MNIIFSIKFDGSQITGQYNYVGQSVKKYIWMLVSLRASLAIKGIFPVVKIHASEKMKKWHSGLLGFLPRPYLFSSWL